MGTHEELLLDSQAVPRYIRALRKVRGHSTQVSSFLTLEDRSLRPRIRRPGAAAKNNRRIFAPLAQAGAAGRVSHCRSSPGWIRRASPSWSPSTWISWSNPPTSVIAVLSGIVCCWADVAGWANWQRRRLVARMIGDVVLALRRDVFRARCSMTCRFSIIHAPGKIVSRITSDTQFSEVASLVTDLISEVLQMHHPVRRPVEHVLAASLLALAITPLVILFALAFRRIARLTTRGAVFG